ncbi:hypothetical protein PL81_26960 [Streptomyces sp. RSD-27]|nr:hypothetical protein PL81_26960 [Streptomyces sp. RSD-27]
MIPPRARSFQRRFLLEQLRESASGAGPAVSRCVLQGAGGVGKTQLAADYARSALQSGAVDLLVWVSASNRSATVSGYAQAAVEVLGADPADPEHAAHAFAAWLEPKAGTPPCRWLVVLDDVADPGDLRGLWPPASPHGRTLVTTRRRDAALGGEGRSVVPVGLFTPSAATAYLSASLAAQGRHEPAPQLTALAADLGYLPLALSQAAAYLIDADVDSAAYRRLLADQTNRLTDLLPDPDVLPDDQSATVAAAWELSIARADQLRPAGLSRPMLQLAAMLDPNGIPLAVLTSPPALAHLAATRALQEPAGSIVQEAQAVGALRALHRLSLIDHTPGTPHQAVRVHQLLQRAVGEPLPAVQRTQLARTAAEALIAAWPDIERDTDLAQALRANSDALQHRSQDSLWQPDCHVVLFKAGESLGSAGQVNAAVGYFQQLADTAAQRLGADHLATLDARLALAQWRYQAEDRAGAAAACTELLEDLLRVLRPDHPKTLAVRYCLSSWRGGSEHTVRDALLLVLDTGRVLGLDHPDYLATRGNYASLMADAGDFAEAAAVYAELLEDMVRVLGPDHPRTLTTRFNLAHGRGMAGDTAGAAAACAELLEDMVRVLGPDHPRTLDVRFHASSWQAEAGDTPGAAAACAELLQDMLRVLGPDHPRTLDIRFHLVHWQGETGDAAGAAAACADLLIDTVRVLGPDHPNTDATWQHLDYWERRASEAAEVSRGDRS